jgi:hypothetical protein
LHNQASDEGKAMTNMRKIHLLGLALIAVFAFGAIAASAAMAGEPTGGEKAFWLLNGVAIANGEANGIKTETEGTIVLGSLETGVEIECSGIFHGTAYNLGATEGENGFGLVTEILDLGGVGHKELAGAGIKCTSLTPSLCENAGGHPEVWPDNLPWLVTLVLMTLDSEEKAVELFLALFSADPTNLPAYEVLCLTFGGTITVEELCQGETSADLELMNEPTGMILLGTFVKEELELEGLEGECKGKANVAFQTGNGVIKPVGGGELDVSSTR